MAAALPLAGVDAWRVYFGLPLFGSRAPAGGMEAIMRRMMHDYVLDVFQPVVEGAAAEAPAAIAAVGTDLHIGDGPLAFVGGSAGGAVALQVLLAGELAVSAMALVNPAIQLASIVALGQRLYGVNYPWTDASREIARRHDIAARAAEIDRRQPRPPMLLVLGEADEPELREPAASLAVALGEHYAGDTDRLSTLSIAGMGHPIAEEPGIDPAPQTDHARQVDAGIAAWFKRWLSS